MLNVVFRWKPHPYITDWIDLAFVYVVNSLQIQAKAYCVWCARARMFMFITWRRTRKHWVVLIVVHSVPEDVLRHSKRNVRSLQIWSQYDKHNILTGKPNHRHPNDYTFFFSFNFYKHYFYLLFMFVRASVYICGVVCGLHIKSMNLHWQFLLFKI